ncbi:MAG: hypothetical protein EORIYHIE_000859, partial [Candidatus Fervidibacter sp.]
MPLSSLKTNRSGRSTAEFVTVLAFVPARNLPQYGFASRVKAFALGTP